MEGRIEVSDEPRVPSGGRRARRRTAARSTWISRAARWTTGRRRATRSRSSRAKSSGPGRDKRGGKASAYWVSSNTGGSARKGTLSSVPFRVTQPYASFLVSGGAFTSTRVDAGAWQARSQTDRSSTRISGAEQRDAAAGGRRPEAIMSARTSSFGWWTTRPARRRRAYIKESPWAHINFDHFRFHESRPFFPNEITLVGDHHAAADGSGPARRPVGCRGGQGDDRAEGLHGQARRRRSPTSCSRSRFTLDDRGRLWVAEAHTYPAARARRPGQGPHPDLRGHQRRRHARQPQGLHREPEPRQRPRGRLRRRLGRRGAVPAVHPGQGRRRSSRPGRRRSCSTAGATRTRTRRSTRSSGGPTAGSTAPTACSRTRTSASRARPTPSASGSTPASGAITRRSTSSKSSPTARATRGASTSTTTATRSRPRASSRTSFTSSRARATSGRPASTSTRTPTTTSRPSPITSTGSAARDRTPATAGRTRPAAATPTPAR